MPRPGVKTWIFSAEEKAKGQLKYLFMSESKGKVAEVMFTVGNVSVIC